MTRFHKIGFSLLRRLLLWCSSILLLNFGLTPLVHAVPATIATVDFDTDNAVTTATITGGGYVTPFGTALFSGASRDWSVGTSLGTYFQVPTFQYNYSPSGPVHGDAQSSVTLGQDERFPETSFNERDIVLLGWGSGNGAVNGTGNDLAVFEQATSEAFAIRVHDTASGWSQWYQRPYESIGSDPSALANDTTPTLFDLSDLGLAADAVINAMEITNLLPVDTVNIALGGGLGYGTVFFGGSTTPGEDYIPARYSSSQGQYVAYEDHKFDPDIQYVVALHDLATGVSDTISALDQANGFSSPQRLAPTDFSTPADVPEPGAVLLVGVGMALLGLVRRRWVV